MKFVGLVAPKSGGKDSVYEILKDQKRVHGKVSFAGPLKEICSEVFGIPMQVLNDPDLKEKPLKEEIKLTAKLLREVKNQCVKRLDPMTADGLYLYNPNKATITGLEGMVIKTPRQLLQVIGTDFIRERIYKEWHVRAAFAPQALAKLPVKSGIYCVTDTRFPNEYEALKNLMGSDFVCYYVERPSAEEKLAQATHESELGVKAIRALLPEGSIIQNDGSLKDLAEICKTLKLPERDKEKTNANQARSGKFVFEKK